MRGVFWQQQVGGGFRFGTSEVSRYTVSKNTVLRMEIMRRVGSSGRLGQIEIQHIQTVSQSLSLFEVLGN